MITFKFIDTFNISYDAEIITNYAKSHGNFIKRYNRLPLYFIRSSADGT